MQAMSNGNTETMSGRKDVPSTEVQLGEDEIASLTADVASRWKLFALASIPNPPPAYEPVCEYTTLQACQEVNPECIYSHFEPIIRPWTDVSLGQCSYLNMCYGDPLFLNNPSLANANQSRSAPIQRPANNNHQQKSSKQCREQERERNAIPHLDHCTRQKILAPGHSGSSRCLESEEAQWLNIDVRDMNATALGSFDLILADPPWDIHMTLPYGTLSDDDLRALPIPSLQPTWGVLALWVTGRAMELARELFKAWGYRRIDEIVWVKVGQLGGLVRTGRTGHWLNHTCEHLLIALKLPSESEFPDRSAPVPWDSDPRLDYLKRGVDGDVVVAEGRETSRKPDEFYGILERLVPIGSCGAYRSVLET
ncbi:hypothetical protein QFC22_004322 [Naganishia vaughanmartiniae]|uniref:Uncharacterized protein n=1 Tax=Naganishia vaughanmartiniae TaxID=1424756 RepID=A0ACC2X0T4_9TREE|nr:hypothetical protein QFC22_004322 [Naganishia vaughanmartiniae]